MKCPCCDGTGEIEEKAPVALSPMQFRVYDIVRRSKYGIAGKDLVTRMYGDRDDGGPITAEISMHVIVNRLNERLGVVGQRVACGVGRRYRLTRNWE
jgi:cyanate lyase